MTRVQKITLSPSRDIPFSWKLRMFVLADASGVEILSKVLDSNPIACIGEREAA